MLLLRMTLLAGRLCSLHCVTHPARFRSSLLPDMWYARESCYVWAAGDRSHRIPQAEGGEQGDPLMPAMFSLALQPALRALQSELLQGEQALAYLDDIQVQ